MAKTVDQNENSLVFQIGSVISVTKNEETKIYKAVQKLEKLIKQNDGNQRNSDQPNISEQAKFVNREHFQAEKNMEEDLIFFLIIMLFNQKQESKRQKK